MLSFLFFVKTSVFFWLQTNKCLCFIIQISAEKSGTYEKWVAFTIRTNFKPNSHSRLCHFHFEKIYIFQGPKQNKINWRMDPIPTIHSEQIEHLLNEHPSLAPTTRPVRDPPKNRERPVVSTYRCFDVPLLRQMYPDVSTTKSQCFDSLKQRDVDTAG